MMKRYKIRVTGIVQGVGFRPFVYNLATSSDISGFVGNDSEGVFIEAQSTPEDMQQFIRTLEDNPPPLSAVDSVRVQEIPAVQHNGFHIRESVRGAAMSTLISPDMAVCEDCASELHEPGDRREHYPFINCTNCGPRYSIIYDIPYDRPKTSMREFEMCPACSQEYHDPADRRFHAQPNACPVCGPWVEIYDSTGTKLQVKDYAIVLAKKLLKQGSILAIKGMGGFHLACDASNALAVQQLRDRKHREEKPLAVMVKDMDTAQALVHLNEEEISLLTSQQSPIVLARKKTEINQFIAPGNPRLGIMLPYTPLHQLLFNHSLDVLVMTSANVSEEPICIENHDAFLRLEGIADYFLTHNRDILQRVDDSVTIVLEEQPCFVRRSRGYVPAPIKLLHSSRTILGVGAELKNTLCYTKAGSAFVSQHVGDLKNVRALDFFHQTREHMAKILEIQPEYLAYDMHPGYLSTQWALEQDIPKF
ncbi:MAG: carbamoyltransferase HypF, partial [Candidatus Marinimicrobia bacterium]|nr:carbamoyltransferase HypF [Candidatus Neomarinimicrobiota bacterium]